MIIQDVSFPKPPQRLAAAFASSASEPRSPGLHAMAPFRRVGFGRRQKRNESVRSLGLRRAA